MALTAARKGVAEDHGGGGGLDFLLSIGHVGLSPREAHFFDTEEGGKV